MFYTDNRLSIVTFSHKDIGKLIQNLNPDKTHGHDNISICMLINMWFTRTIYRPLGLIFKEALSTGLFPLNWKKGNIVPIYKKGDKQILKNYNPVSLLSICEKIFERLIFQDLFNVLLENENGFISPNQFGFIPGDSCINQLLPIAHEIFDSLDEGFEVRRVFLVISKVFDKVWNKGLLFKSLQNDIFGNS